MKRVWKWVMHLNAKMFCIIAALLVVATVGWCAVLYVNPPTPLKEGSGKLPDPPEPWVIGIIDFVTNQLAGDDLSIPIEPFRPTMEAILGNPEEKAKILAAMKAARNPQAAGAAKEDPFKGLRGNNAADAAAAGANMITPKISFDGFIKRSDGTMTARFTDSSDKSTVFYSPGATVHGIEILGADMREAQVKFPDGSIGKIPIGANVELAPEPAKAVAPPPAPVATAKAAAAKAKK